MIEQAIHEILDDVSIPDSVTLSALLPTERIVTGQHHDRDLPYASINLEGNITEYRSNCGSARNQRLRFQVWHENHSLGSEIATAIENLFENKTFTTSVLNIIRSRHENSLTMQEDDGVWQFLIDFQIATVTP